MKVWVVEEVVVVFVLCSCRCFHLQRVMVELTLWCYVDDWAEGRPFLCCIGENDDERPLGRDLYFTWYHFRLHVVPIFYSISNGTFFFFGAAKMVLCIVFHMVPIICTEKYISRGTKFDFTWYQFFFRFQVVLPIFCTMPDHGRWGFKLDTVSNGTFWFFFLCVFIVNKAINIKFTLKGNEK